MGVVTIHDQDVGREKIFPLPIIIFESYADMVKGCCLLQVFSTADVLLPGIAAVCFHASKVRPIKCKIHLFHLVNIPNWFSFSLGVLDLFFHSRRNHIAKYPKFDAAG